MFIILTLVALISSVISLRVFFKEHKRTGEVSTQTYFITTFALVVLGLNSIMVVLS